MSYILFVLLASSTIDSSAYNALVEECYRAQPIEFVLKDDDIWSKELPTCNALWQITFAGGDSKY